MNKEIQSQTVERITADQYFPDLSKYIGYLDDSARLYKRFEEETFNGPEPAQVSGSNGQVELRSIKRQSRHPIGRLLVDAIKQALKVNGIVGPDGQTDERWKTWWKRNNMDRKLSILVDSMATGGTGYLHNWVDDAGFERCDVKNPKQTITFSVDRVNDEFANYALERREVPGGTWFIFYDSANVTEFYRGKDDTATYFVDQYSHEWGECPIVPIDVTVLSTGRVFGEIELMIPVFDTYRTRSNALNSGTYWQGLRQLVIKNVDRNSYRIDEKGKRINMFEEIMEALEVNEAGFLALPVGEGNQGSPEVQQTQEANLAQLIEGLREIKQTISALTGIPLFIFDPTATPETAEGAVQAKGRFAVKMATWQQNIGDRLESILRQNKFNKTGELDYDTYIQWAAIDADSDNVEADTLSKNTAAGIPIEWSVINGMKSYSPEAKSDLLDRIEEDKASKQALTNYITGQGSTESGETF